MLSVMCKEGDTFVIGDYCYPIEICGVRSYDGREPDVAISGVIGRWGDRAWTYVRLNKPYKFGIACLTFLSVPKDNEVEIRVEAEQGARIEQETIANKKIVRITLQ